MDDFYTRENLQNVNVQTLRMLTVMGHHCGLKHNKIELILKIISEKQKKEGKNETTTKNKN